MHWFPCLSSVDFHLNIILGPKSYGNSRKQIPGPLDTESVALPLGHRASHYVMLIVMSKGT